MNKLVNDTTRLEIPGFATFRLFKVLGILVILHAGNSLKAQETEKKPEVTASSQLMIKPNSRDVVVTIRGNRMQRIDKTRKYDRVIIKPYRKSKEINKKSNIVKRKQLNQKRRQVIQQRRALRR